MTAADVLRKAKALLEERGWCQRGFSCGNAVCILGACNLAKHGDVNPLKEAFWAEEPFAFLRDDVRAVAERDYSANQREAPTFCWVGLWNDQNDRTLEQVLAAFDRAIALAEQEASS